MKIETQVQHAIQALKLQDQSAVAVLLGHEDWLDFSSQSQVSYTPFGSARHHQPALAGLMMLRINQDRGLRVLTQIGLDEYTLNQQI